MSLLSSIVSFFPGRASAGLPGRAAISAFTLVLLLGATLRADSADADLEAANRAYIGGQYEDAAKLFQQIIETRGYSAPLCFNLANAEARAGHVGPALLNYERARYLAPGDRDIENNLQMTRKKAGLEPNSYRWWQLVLRGPSINQWLILLDGWLALIALAIVTHAIAPRLAPSLGLPLATIGKIVKGVLFVSIPCFLFFSFVTLLAVATIQRAEAEAVVVAKDSLLRLSPFATAEKTGTLPEGELVTVQQRHNDYLWIEGRDHHSGWVQEKELEPIIAGSFDSKSSR
jgi:tetratricopeptide (TPR) repeat protein